MGLEDVFQQLGAQLELLDKELQELHNTIMDDHPQEDIVLFDLRSDAVMAMLGWLTEARTAAEHARGAVAGTPDLHRARHELTTCHEWFNRVADKVASDFTAYEPMHELMSLGAEPGGKWRAWVAAMTEMLARCQQRMYDCGQTLFTCWRELAARVGAASVSVQNTNIGQQVELRDVGELSRAGVT